MLTARQYIRRDTGFTMIEVLMVTLLIAILGAVALPQYMDFRNEGKLAAAQSILSTLNMGIKLQRAQAMLRCGASVNVDIPFDSFATNDITAGSSPICTTEQIPDFAQRRFVDSPNFPPNPYNGLITVGDCVNTTYVGYCYNSTEKIVSVSTATSHSNTCTDCFQIANGVGTSTLGCTGSGCIQVCNGISGNCTIDCPGGYCNQTCNGITGDCNIDCPGGHCTQLCNGVSGSCNMTCTGGDCTN